MNIFDKLPYSNIKMNPARPNKPDYSSFLFHESGSEPFPIQRIKWLERILPVIKKVTSTIKKSKNPTNAATNNDLLTTLTYTGDLFEKAFEEDKISVSEKFWHSLIRATTYNVTFMYNWNIFKQSYKFDKDTFDLLCNETDVTELPISVINHNLPYPAFFIDNKFISDENKVFRGCFVSVLYNPENLPELGLLFVEDNDESNYEYCLIPLYMGDLTLLEIMQKRDEKYGVKSTDEDIKTMVGLGIKALKAIIYICSSNSEIKTIKINVADNKNNKSNKNKKKNKKPTTVSQNLVGYRMGNTIRKTKKVYVYESDTNVNVNKSVKKSTKSPHMRMAHYHHFWTGPKNEPDKRKLVLKYIPPLFIGSHYDKDVHPTLHKVK